MHAAPMVAYFRDAIRARGCTLPDDFVRCIPLPDVDVRGQFSTQHSRVILNSITLADQRSALRTVVHELVHAYDHCRVEMDYSDPKHLACTEIRASNLSGECGWTEEFKRMQFGFARQQQKCVARRAALSIRGHTALRDQDPKQVVGSVFRRCFADTEPLPRDPL